MKNHLYRCLNPKCETKEFEAQAPICPGCKIDGRVGRYAVLIQRMAMIHFDAPDPILPNIGVNFAACDVNLKIAGGIMGTAEHKAVTCKKCKGTDIFKTTYPNYDGELPAGVDEEIIIDPVNGVRVAEAKAG
jgi:hypothetical protein